ncbi:GNAT family N-acetyltransferase [Brevundimonas sp.]
MTVLTTERLTLTPVSVADYEDLCALWGNEGFATAILPQAMTPEDVWFRLLRDIGQWQVRAYGSWSVRLTADGDYVGSVGVLDHRRMMTPAFDAPELGWGVAPRFQGHGLAFEALNAALIWCDHTLKVPRTVCMIDPDNTPSHALARRVGYVPYAETSYKAATVVLLERPTMVRQA